MIEVYFECILAVFTSLVNWFVDTLNSLSAQGVYFGFIVIVTGFVMIVKPLLGNGFDVGSDSVRKYKQRRQEREQMALRLVSMR